MLCVLGIGIGGISGAIAWHHPDPAHLAWFFRFAGPLNAALSLAAFLRVHFRKDIGTNYLLPTFGSFFDRDGFCFALAGARDNGYFCIQVFFQNRHSSDSKAQVALRPKHGFFGDHARVRTVIFDIPCPGGAFGVASLPVPISTKYHGKALTFEVGASVEYPEGKGETLWYQDGIVVRTNTKFSGTPSAATRVALLFTGTWISPSATTATLLIPEDVAVTAPRHIDPTIEILWLPGDPSLT